MNDRERDAGADLDGPHDPQPWAAAHLAGDLPHGLRASFETHLLGCEACWGEVQAARAGRALAENLREPAPQALREYLRALSAGTPEPEEAIDRSPGARRTRRAWLSIAAAAVGGAVLAGGLTAGLLGSGEDRPAEAALAAAAAVYRAEGAELDRTGRPPAVQLGALRWQGTARTDLAGRSATVHRYGDGSGHQLLLVSSPQPFPRAKDARTVLGSSWTAQVEGTSMFCVDHGGLSWLVIAESSEQAIEAGRQAGLA